MTSNENKDDYRKLLPDSIVVYRQVFNKFISFGKYHVKITIHKGVQEPVKSRSTEGTND